MQFLALKYDAYKRGIRPKRAVVSDCRPLGGESFIEKEKTGPKGRWTC